MTTLQQALADSMIKAVNYCYRCGKKLGRGQEHCYYCTAPVRRTIRENSRCPHCVEELQDGATKCPHCGEFLTAGGPPRKCPFCSEAIQPDAIKCPHCREFLNRDGEEPRAPAPAPTQNIIFVVDRQLMGGDQPLLITPGENVGGELAQKLGERTRKAIEMGRPGDIDSPSVRALPAPEALALVPAVIDVNAPAVIEAKSKAVALPATSPPAVVSAQLPARVFKGLGRAAWAVTRFTWRALAWAVARKDAEPEEEPPRYRECPKCETEVLTSDNFCYHCGMSFATRQEKRRRAPGAERPSNAGVYFLVLALFGSSGYLYFIDKAGKFFVMVENRTVVPWLMGAACLIAILGVFRRFGIVSVLLALIAAAAFLSLPPPSSP